MLIYTCWCWCWCPQRHQSTGTYFLPCGRQAAAGLQARQAVPPQLVHFIFLTKKLVSLGFLKQTAKPKKHHTFRIHARTHTHTLWALLGMLVTHFGHFLTSCWTFWECWTSATLNSLGSLLGRFLLCFGLQVGSQVDQKINHMASCWQVARISKKG